MDNRIASIAVVCALSAQAVVANGEAPWARPIRGVTETYDPFFLELVTEGSNHLVATAQYTDYGREPEVSHLPSIIDGTRTADNQFWPKVTMEVSNDLTENWHPIASHALGGKITKITVQANDPNEWLHVDLEPFRGMIGKFKYGKVTLTNGERAIFVLNNLLPPTASPRYWSENSLSRIAPFDTPPFVVSAFVSPDGADVLAACGYGDNEVTSVTRLQGTRTPPGKIWPSITGEPDFWPAVTAQAAVDYRGEWTAIATPRLPGEPDTLSIAPKAVVGDLYVNLNNFRPAVGKFRYGKLVLPNGKAAIFELRQLLPVEQDK